MKRDNLIREFRYKQSKQFSRQYILHSLLHSHSNKAFEEMPTEITYALATIPREGTVLVEYFENKKEAQIRDIQLSRQGLETSVAYRHQNRIHSIGI